MRWPLGRPLGQQVGDRLIGGVDAEPRNIQSGAADTCDPKISGCPCERQSFSLAASDQVSDCRARPGRASDLTTEATGPKVAVVNGTDCLSGGGLRLGDRPNNLPVQYCEHETDLRKRLVYRSSAARV